jgi:hypothetical protein
MYSRKLEVITQEQCCGSASALNLSSGTGSGFGVRIRIQVIKYRCQKPKFTIISEVFRDSYTSNKSPQLKKAKMLSRCQRESFLFKKNNRKTT